MIGFSSTAMLVRTTDGRNVEIVWPIIFRRPDEVGGEEIIINKGATSDGASIPAALWGFGLPPFGPYWMACVLHDAMYRRETTPQIDDRSLADLILWEAMIACGVKDDEARLIYNGVRTGGQAAWDTDREVV